MKLEDQVTNINHSIKLKELGVEQESLFYWYKHPNPNLKKYIIGMTGSFNKDYHPTVYSAYTASELMEILPEGVDIMKWKGYSVKSPNEWDRQLKKPNLCEALAEMLIYLIENNKMGN